MKQNQTKELAKRRYLNRVIRVSTQEKEGSRDHVFFHPRPNEVIFDTKLSEYFDDLRYEEGLHRKDRALRRKEWQK